MKRQYLKSGASRRSVSSPISGLARTPIKRSAKRRRIERSAVAIMLLIAWAWIMVFFGMIFYHGYQYRTVKGTSTGAGDIANADRIDEPDHSVLEEPKSPQKTRRKPDSANITEFKLVPHGSPLIVFTCKRANYLRDTLDDILKYIPPDCSIGCPVIVSQDGNDAEVVKVIAEFQKKLQSQKGVPLKHLEHKSALRRGSNAADSYIALAKHYGWALGQVFDGHALVSKTTTVLPQRVLILEEDLHIAPDFFGYFAAMAPILESDNSLLAVSAFNDNGFENTVKDANRVLRSDFFPGLGWMMTRKLWTNELKLKWAPTGYWDDWLREPAQRQGRDILRPEISRTFHFGVKGGTSQNQFGASLTKVFLNHDAVSWEPNVSDRHHWSYYLQNQDVYDRQYWNLLQASQLVTTVADALEQSKVTNVRLEYRGLQQFQKLAQQLNIMNDEKAGIPRTAYKGVVETRPHGDHFLFLTPPMNDLQKEFNNAVVATIAEDVLAR